MANFRPMLAAKLKAGETYEEKLPKLDWDSGIICTPKLDGIRIVMHPSLGPVTRTLKPIPNNYLRAKYEALYPYISGFDGELIFGDHENKNYSFQKTFSAFSSYDGEPKEMRYHVFDDMTHNIAYHKRIDFACTRVCDLDHPSVKYVFEEFAYTLEAAYSLEEMYLGQNYEGAMLRHPDGLYKEGRSTYKQQGLIALKRTVDCEGIVFGMEPLLRNNNEATIDNLGLQVRSSHKANKEEDALMGKLWVKGIPGTPFDGMEFKVGSGFDVPTRIKIWNNQDDYIGKQITFKYQAHGIKDKPRQAIFKSFRNGF